MRGRREAGEFFDGIPAHNKDVSAFCLDEVAKVDRESDFGYWLYGAVNTNMGVIMLLFIIVLFLMVVSKCALFYQFVKYARYGMKDFYTRRSRFTLLVTLQLLLIGSFFAMLLGTIAIVIQKALVTPQNLDQVLNETWGQEDPITGMANNNGNV